MVCNFHHHVRHLSVRGFIWALTFTSLSYRTGEVDKATLNLVLRFKPSVIPSSTILFKQYITLDHDPFLLLGALPKDPIVRFSH